MALKDSILSQLRTEIEYEFPENRPGEIQTALEKDLEQQEQFLEMIGDGFIPRKGDFSELEYYIHSESNRIFVLTAAAGLGKTTLLANYIAKPKNDGHRVYARFCGASDLSAEQYSLWKSILDEAGIDCPATLKRTPAQYRRTIGRAFGYCSDRRRQPAAGRP